MYNNDFTLLFVLYINTPPNLGSNFSKKSAFFCFLKLLLANPDSLEAMAQLSRDLSLSSRPLEDLWVNVVLLK